MNRIERFYRVVLSVALAVLGAAVEGRAEIRGYTVETVNNRSPRSRHRIRSAVPTRVYSLGPGLATLHG